MKKYRALLLAYTLSLAFLGYLSYAINFHPYGLQLELHENVLEVNKGIVNEEKYVIPIEDNFDSIVFLIKEINQLINSWFVFLFIISLFVAGFLGFFKIEFRANLNLAKYLYLYLGSLSITLILGIAYFHYHGSIILDILDRLG